MKSSVKIILIVIAVIIALAVIAVLLLRQYGKNNILDGPGMVNETVLTSVRIYSGGGMDGGHHEVRLSITDDETGAVAFTEDREYWNAETEKHQRTVDISAISDVDMIIRENSMMNWEDCPKSELLALDAPTTSVTITFSNASFSFSSSQELPDGGWEKVRELESMIRALAQE